MDGGAWWAAVHGVAKSSTRLSDFKESQHIKERKAEVPCLNTFPLLLTGLLRELPRIPWPHLRNDGWETSRVEITLSKIAGEQCFSSSSGCPCVSGQIV